MLISGELLDEDDRVENAGAVRFAEAGLAVEFGESHPLEKAATAFVFGADAGVDAGSASGTGMLAEGLDQLLANVLATEAVLHIHMQMCRVIGHFRTGTVSAF